MQTISVKTSQRNEMIDVTRLVEQVARESGVEFGTLICFVRSSALFLTRRPPLRSMKLLTLMSDATSSTS